MKLPSLWSRDQDLISDPFRSLRPMEDMFRAFYQNLPSFSTGCGFCESCEFVCKRCSYGLFNLLVAGFSFRQVGRVNRESELAERQRQPR